jgi:hypothetical protein
MMFMVFCYRAITMPGLGLNPWTAPINYSSGLLIGVMVGWALANVSRNGR